jgi:hypothetical protein
MKRSTRYGAANDPQTRRLTLDFAGISFSTGYALAYSFTFEKCARRRDACRTESIVGESI